MRVLVTGGAGYIGRYVLRALGEAGCEGFWLDLTRGVGPGLVCDMRDAPALLTALRRVKPQAVIHLAARSSVAESVADPGAYTENVAMCRHLAAALPPDFPVALASSAAVYGEVADVAREDTRPAPATPYGWSKLASEAALPMAMALRLFNVAGGSGDQGDHLIPRAVQALLAAAPLQVNGDGTIERDYVHVEDVARAFVAAVLARSVGVPAQPLNICRGHAVPVSTVRTTVAQFADVLLPMVHGPARPGDVQRIVGDNRRALEVLGWAPEFNFEHIVASAVRAARQSQKAA